MKLGWGTIDDAGAYRDEAPLMEQAGYDTLFAAEVRHDAFIRCAVMAERTSSAEIMTNIAVALARSPMVIAMAAHELNALSQGRFILGLGSQVEAHITRRYAMPWSRPAARMRETVQALHAIWDAWYEGKRLDFRGNFHSFTLMNENFTPAERRFGRPPVHLAAVGPAMTRVAAETADGMICHAFTTPRYLREVTLPAIEKGLAARGRTRASFELSGRCFIACAEDDEGLERAIERVKGRIAFYGSTPAYRAVLDLHGLGALHEELNRLSKEGRWAEMARLIGDDVLGLFAVVGKREAVVAGLKGRVAGVLDRLHVVFEGVERKRLPGLLAGLKG